MPTRYVIRFDDVVPKMAWTKFAPFERLSDEFGLPFLLGVVPDCRDPSLMVEQERADFWAWLRQKKASGHTIAQHGDTHLYTTEARGVLGIGRKSEFAGLSYEAQVEKLAHGKAILEREGVWQGVFMAPSHSFDALTINALKALGFTAITDGYGFYAYDLEGLMAVPQLLSRPLGLGIGVETVCLHVNTLSDEAIRRMVDFLRAHREDIISFNDAMTFAAPSEFMGGALRVASEAALRLYRTVRG
jgi:predicted deacetylase